MLDGGKFVFGTDNFYKFLAITGALVLVFSIVYPIQKQLEIQLQSVRIENQFSIINLEYRDLKSRFNKVVEDTTLRKKQVNDIYKTYDSIGNIEGFSSPNAIKLKSEYLIVKDRFEKSIAEIDSLSKDLETKIINTKSLNSEIICNKEYLENTMSYFSMMTWISLVFLVIGSIFWIRNQIVTDRFNRLNNKKVELEIGEFSKNKN